MSDEPARARQQKPTAKAVAERSGVSVTTVSRVLNGRAEVIPEETRERVLVAARELRYRPSSLAVSLRRGYTKTIGLLVPDIADAYFHQIARGLEDAAWAEGYTVMLFNTDRIAEKERACVEVLYDQNADAVVFAGGGVDDDAHLRDLPWDLMHVVTVGPHKLPFPSIRVDDVGAVALAMDHLFEQECQHILCITGRESWLINSERTKGYRQGLESHSVPYDPALVINGSFTVQAGYEAVDRALDSGLTFDAVMAFNDYTAVGAMQALTERGLRIPDDVAVVGCDDIPLASLVSPGLTSVSFPQYDFGRAAMLAVLDHAAGRSVAPVTEFPYHLKVRESSLRRAAGACRSGHEHTESRNKEE
ncbi:LacI family DNA-binding transcriptional regulator [Amycolatopsis palatopharyngis]|uniref:LacI family DNA-binding transcriptional regulator n=1 Tax=Amycolatopsis palatopharyngis TaxID=187982 RepID=UPI000E24D44F|nr:LacI family DNA-binding transcriptional regulator [Amycolatopsis palatopharyngis]